MFPWFKKKETEQIEENLTQRNFDDTTAKKILSNIKKEFGLDYSKQEFITLRKVERFALQNDIYDFTELAIKIESSRELKEKFINMLTVGETYFYREEKHFQILIEHMKNKSINKILCAPCSSGEEVYSILLSIQNAFAVIPKLTITGIDINSKLLEEANRACYSQRSVSLIPEDILRKNFVFKNEKYCIHPYLKEYVSFERKNIFDAAELKKLGSFDIIFCRNMLIYFDERQKREALENLRALLTSKGFLFIGHADISFEPNGFVKIDTHNGIYLQKST